MAGKKLPKDIDLTKKINPADGFFSTPAPEKERFADKEEEKENSPSGSKDSFSKKNVGGRPPKKGLKNEQFTLTMHPELYEKLRIIAQERTGGNFSALIENAVNVYCRENNINLNNIKVSQSVLKDYQIKQDKKRRNKK